LEINYQPLLVLKENKSKWIINSISIIVPLAVAILLSIPNKLNLGEGTQNFPHAIGLINTLTTLVLISGFVFIKKGKIEFHRRAMTLAFVLGSLFLIFYVMHHLTNPVNKFAGVGGVRYFYFFILITHIGLSLIVLPLVLRAMYYAVTKQFDLHRRWVKYAYPIWLYVSVTGVIVYLLNYQLFPGR
jgi:putative membrane protein